jgi:hypothetical protein
MINLLHKAVYSLQVAYLMTGIFEYSGMSFEIVTPEMMHQFYVWAFVSYAAGHVVVDIIPKVVAAAMMLRAYFESEGSKE